MGWNSASEIFDPVAKALIDANVGDKVLRDVLGSLIEKLQAQTRSENNLGGRLGDVQRARHAAITRCPQGHPYDSINTYLRSDRPAGGRMCRTCHRDACRRHAARRRESVRT